MEFGQRLSILIKRQGFSVRGFARTWKPANPEYGRRKLYGYLSEGRVPTDRTMQSLAEALGISVEELRNGSAEAAA